MMKMKKFTLGIFTVLLAFGLSTPAFAAKGGAPASDNGKGKTKTSIVEPAPTTEPILPAEITLVWDPSDDPQVIGYRLYYKESFADDPSYQTPPFDSTGLYEGESPIDVGKNETLTLNLPYDTTIFCFAVTTYNSDGLESDYSNIVCTTN
jgi:hypothetical protein